MSLNGRYASRGTSSSRGSAGSAGLLPPLGVLNSGLEGYCVTASSLGPTGGNGGGATRRGAGSAGKAREAAVVVTPGDLYDVADLLLLSKKAMAESDFGTLAACLDRIKVISRTEREQTRKMAREGGSAFMLDLLDASFENVELAYPLVQIVGQMVQVDTKNMRKLGAARVLFRTMAYHFGSREMFLSLIETLVYLSKTDKSVSLMARMEGGIKNLVANLRTYSGDASFLATALCAVGPFAASENSLSTFGKVKAVSVLLGILRTHKANLEIMHLGLQGLAVLVKSEANAVAFDKELGFEVMLEVIQDFQDELDVVKRVLQILKHVSRRQKVVAGIMGSECWVSIVRVVDAFMQQHETNMEILRLCCSTLLGLHKAEFSTVPDEGVKCPLPEDEATGEYSEVMLEDALALDMEEIFFAGGGGGDDDDDDDDGSGGSLGSVQQATRSFRRFVSYPQPQHIAAIPPAEEPLFLRGTSTFIDIVRQDIRRLANPERVINQVVYDNTVPVVGPTVASTSAEGLSSAGPPPRSSAGAGRTGSATSSRAGMSRQGSSESDGESLSSLGEAAGSMTVPMTPWNLLPPQTMTEGRLWFESRFEGGNLARATQIYETEFDLLLSPDTNTVGHVQWFSFAVGNVRSNLRYKFNILNFEKNNSQFNYGMMPVMYSTKLAAKSGVGWFRVGSDICYFPNRHQKQRKGRSLPCFTLSFTLHFPCDNDVCYIAYHYPYTYTDLQTYLGRLQQLPGAPDMMRRQELCKTLGGNSCDLLTVTKFAESSELEVRARPVVVLTARVHPGETNSSWIMQGVLSFLLSDLPAAARLRQMFVFKIVPMLNPDGVINGNHRCSLSGQDLNRQWITPSRTLHPTIYHTKALMRRLRLDGRDVVLYCDMHGHSRRKHVFIFGCHNDKSDKLRHREKIFPWLLSKGTPLFSMRECDFAVQESKAATGRIAIRREFGVLNCFTMESTYCGSANHHFHVGHLLDMGKVLCETLIDLHTAGEADVAQWLAEIKAFLATGFHPDDDGDDDDDDDPGFEQPPPIPMVPDRKPPNKKRVVKKKKKKKTK